MSEQAIRKLQKKFIMVSMAALLITITLVAGLLYLSSAFINLQTIRNTLQYIIESGGELVRYDEDAEEESSRIENYLDVFDQIFSTSSMYRSQEFQYSTRYFAVIIDENGNITEVNTSHIQAVSEEQAREYALEASEGWLDFGRFDTYYYQRDVLSSGEMLIVFLDGSSVIWSNRRLLYLAVMLVCLGMVIAFLIVRALSKRVIAGELKNAELQKQFMTNASHELKTPLAVIRANTEMIEMLNGESEWTESTKNQVNRMDGLIKNLVSISRSDEKRMENIAEAIDVAKVVAETAENFQGLAQGNGKTLEIHADEKLMLLVDDTQIRQLTSLLVDNAIKYCDDEGMISVEVKKRGKGMQLLVSNDYAEGENVDYTKFFERFYREDTSHNVDKGGYGIGLSVAESIVKNYHGKIDVSWEKGRISFICFMRSFV